MPETGANSIGVQSLVGPPPSPLLGGGVYAEEARRYRERRGPLRARREDSVT